MSAAPVLCLAVAASLQEPGQEPSLADLGGFITRGEGLRGVQCCEPPAEGDARVFGSLFSGERAAPAASSPLLRAVSRPSSGWAFLRDFDLSLKTFQVKDAGSGIGSEFAYRRNLPLGALSDAYEVTLDLALNGLVAFDHARLPSDFLNGRLGFDLYGAYGGHVALTEEEKSAFMRAGADAAGMSDPEQVAALAAPWIRRMQRGGLSNQFCWGLWIDGGVEADQAFSNVNYTLGGSLFVDWKPWDANSAGAWFNLPDYPFAVLRLLTGYDEEFRLRGHAFPALLAGVDRVLPHDALRAAAGDDSNYWRARVEVSFKTPVGQVSDEVYFFSANYRLFQELDAAAAVKAAQREQYSFLQVALGGDDGVYVSYATGELPFGVANAQVYELGWKFHF